MLQFGETDERCYLGSCEVVTGTNCEATASLSSSPTYQYYARQLDFADCSASGINNVANGNLGNCSADSVLPHGSSCSLVCAAGYESTGEQPACSNGVITQSVACLPLACAVLANPANGLLQACTAGAVVGSPFPSGSSCQVVCGDGYELAGAPTVSCTTGQMTMMPSCIPPSCSVSAPVNGGWGTCDSSGVLMRGESCTMTCAAGYVLIGSGLTCASLLSQTPRCVTCGDTISSCYDQALTLTDGFTASCSPQLLLQCGSSCNPVRK